MTSIKQLTQQWANEQKDAHIWNEESYKKAASWGRYFARILRNTHNVTLIHKVTRQIINKYLENYSKTRANHSVKNQQKFIKSFFLWCTKKGILLSSPASHIKCKRQNICKQILTKEQIKTLLTQNWKTSYEKQLKMIIELLYASALRIAELINLNLSNLDFCNNTITIEQGKGSKFRIVPLIPIVKKQLKYFVENIHSKLAKKGEISLFVGQKGRRINRDVLQANIRKIATKTKISFSCHTLRRSCATHLLENGVNVIYISQLLGHEDLRTTQQYLNIEENYLKLGYIKHPRDTIKTQ